MFGHRRLLACSFCGKKETEVARLVAGPNAYIRRKVYICDGCVSIASRIMEDAEHQGPHQEESRAKLFDRLLGRICSVWTRHKLSQLATA